MNRKQKRLVRIIAIVLAVLLAGGAVVSAIISMASAEEMPKSEHNACTMAIEYMEEEQALRITQRLVYRNTTEGPLTQLIFRAAANVFRRSERLFYEDDVIEAAFPFGYVPGGIEIVSVKADGSAAEYGYRNGETELVVLCDLDTGAQCIFEFEYYLLLTQNHAFLGIGENGWRLSDFYLTPEIPDCYGEFICDAPVAFTRYIYTPATDFDVSITLPGSCVLAATGEECVSEKQGGANVWSVHAENVHDFSMAFGAKYRVKEKTMRSGTVIRCVSAGSGREKELLHYAEEAIEVCEELFGAFPFSQFDIVETDIAMGAQCMSGVLWMDRDTMKSKEAEHTIRYAVAQQYFGCGAYVQPAEDAWLSDSISEYIAYFIEYKVNGKDAYMKALNRGAIPSLQYTIPGGLEITSNASRMMNREYRAIIRDRGAAVFHEMSIDMGIEGLIGGLRNFYELGRSGITLTERDLVNAFDKATGYAWEKALTDWVFNIGDYAEQQLDSLE